MERELLFSESLRAVGAAFIMRELWWDLIIVPSFVHVCVCLCVCPSAARPFRAQPVLSALCEGALSDPAVQLTLPEQCIDFGRLLNTEGRQRLVHLLKRENEEK